MCVLEKTGENREKQRLDGTKHPLEGAAVLDEKIGVC